MQMTMRWFGPVEDKIPLAHIRQVPGVEGVVGALYDVPVGEVWPQDKVLTPTPMAITRSPSAWVKRSATA